MKEYQIKTSANPAFNIRTDDQCRTLPNPECEYGYFRAPWGQLYGGSEPKHIIESLRGIGAIQLRRKESLARIWHSKIERLAVGESVDVPRNDHPRHQDDFTVVTRIA